MAKGNTIGRELITDLDNKVIDLCNLISQEICCNISKVDKREEFLNEFGKTHKSRDAGYGKSAGKLQRDALCTRGITSLGPFSNRNLRWHPLIIAKNDVTYAKPIERIEIEGEDCNQTLIFVVKENGTEVKYTPTEVYKLKERFVVLPRHWEDNKETIKDWDDTLWVQNSCIIPAYESCNWWDAIQTYAVLAMSVACEKYDVSFNDLQPKIKDVLLKSDLGLEQILVLNDFPEDKESIVNCPLCKVPVSKNPADLSDKEREDRFSFGFKGKKRKEGDEGSRQIMHIEPLTESEIRHTAKNVRFGHRWCNVAMTDHSITDTLEFMKYIVNAHTSND